MSFMDDPTNQVKSGDIDWVSLNRRLLPCALRLFKGKGCREPDSVLPGTGMSANDLASNTLLKLMKSDEWRSNSPNGDPFPFAYTVMRRDFLDLIRSGAARTTQIIEDADIGFREPPTSGPAAENDGLQAAEAASLFELIKRVIRPDPLMAAYLEAVAIKGLDKREEIAQEMGVTPQEVTNVKRRLTPKLELIRRVFSAARMRKTQKV